MVATLCRRGVDDYCFVVVQQEQLQDEEQLQQPLASLSDLHPQVAPQAQVGVHEQGLLGVVASSSIICIYIEHLVLGLTRCYGHSTIGS